jgi:hypothetical protein
MVAPGRVEDKSDAQREPLEQRSPASGELSSTVEGHDTGETENMPFRF